MSLVFQTYIVPDESVVDARQIAVTLAGSEGEGMWTTPLSADGAAPATHWISTGWVDEQFAQQLASAPEMATSDISAEEWPVACERMGLQPVQEASGV